MRRVTRNLVLGILAVLVLLLALGAVPSLLRSGDPYYVSATPLPDANATDGDATAGNATAGNATAGPGTDATAVNASRLSERTFPYTTAALANASVDRTGYSEPYWEGPVGIKDTFTHSPFDELASLSQRNANTTADGGVRVSDNGTLYRLGVTQDRP